MTLTALIDWHPLSDAPPAPDPDEPPTAIMAYPDDFNGGAYVLADEPFMWEAGRWVGEITGATPHPAAWWALERQLVAPMAMTREAG